MKIESTKEKLLNTVSLADRVTGKNLSLPVLNNILLLVEGKSLIVRATNLDLGIELSIPVKVEEDGLVVVPGGVLNSTLQHIYDGGMVSLATKKENLVITTPQSTSIIKSLSSEDFPTLPKIKKGYTLILKAKDFLKGVRAVWYCASTSTIKPELSSIYIHNNNNTLLFAATDSFRLAEQSIPTKSLPEFEPVLIPSRNVPEIIKILESVDANEIVFDFTRNQLSITAGEVYLTSRLIDGIFPDYKQIVPEKHTTEAVLLKQDLLNALKKASVFSDKFNQVRLSIKPSKKSMFVESSNKDVGETKDTIAASVTGEDIEINFNLKYVMDAFQSIPTDSISLSLGGVGKPMVIRGVSDNSFLYLVMPMNR